MAETNDERVDDVLSAVERLGPAIKARALIEQAKALLMAELGCDDRQAFGKLVEVSQRQHVKLTQVAQRVRDTAMASDGVPSEAIQAHPQPDAGADL